MPREYAGAGVLAEHSAVRTAVGHLRRQPPRQDRRDRSGAADYVNTRLSNDLGKITPGQAQYTLLCADDGGVVDDMIAYLAGPDDLLIDPERGQLRRGRRPPGRRRPRRRLGRGPAHRLRGARGAGHPVR